MSPICNSKGTGFDDFEADLSPVEIWKSIISGTSSVIFLNSKSPPPSPIGSCGSCISFDAAETEVEDFDDDASPEKVESF
mmetsp:Transcript_21902/g.44562  ORF Transcript_21902/g.44562 Transcript_21902/m.44562 type:complete len:80 (+) Transcript_21902:2727-2966(+)